MTTQVDPTILGQGRIKQDYIKDEFMKSGHFACPGCGATMSMRLALKALGNDIVVVIPACCWAVIPGPFPYTNLDTPLMHTAFETTGATVSGVRAALDVQGKENTLVMGWAGDGGTFDIGFQSLSAAAERNENILYVCYDNEAYMNTGIQRSSATPESAWTTTTPVNEPKKERKKDVDFIMVDHNIPYVASCLPAYPHDMIEKFKRAKTIKGFRFIHVFSSCTAGWKIPSEKSVEVMRSAVETRVFPLFEVVNGKWSITVNPEHKPVKDYLMSQGRFRHMKPADVEEFQKQIDNRWNAIQTKIKCG